LSVIGVAAIDATLAGYFLYAPSAEVPKLSGTVEHGRIVAGGLKRTYLLYVPRGLTKGAPLIVAMHGSGENGSRMRIQTGYGFDRLADKYGFAVVYPDGYEGYWNGCNIVGDYSANTLSIDDVGFLTHLVDKLAGDIGVDRSKVFAMGISRGGSMALRLALETPSAFRAVASVSDSVPAPANFKCKPAGHGTSSVMIMNGTSDPIVPFDGGEVSLFGLFIKRGPVLSSRASAQYFADLNHLGGKLQTSETQKADGVLFERVLWHSDSGMDVELVAIHGGGHGMPQPYQRHMRLLGPSPMAPNGPELIWNFFTKTAGDRRP
jgi:polyhydroxybutyrate depolymerase